MTSPKQKAHGKPKEPWVWSLHTLKPVDVNLKLDKVKKKKALFTTKLLHSTDMGGATASVGEKLAVNVLTY